MHAIRSIGALTTYLFLCSCGGNGAPESQAPASSSPGTATPVAAVPLPYLVLEVLDREGTKVTLTQAETYFKDTGYIPVKYTRLFGIELKQGAGNVDVGWNRIERVDLSTRVGEYGASELVCILHLTGDEEVSAPCSGTQYVAGNTPLGSYEVYLEDLKSIRVVSRPQPPGS
jgi:hypothetical protein